jgi:CRISPR-associated protein Cst2
VNSKGFITLTVVFEAMSLNRDEGLGNIQSLHLLTRGNGDVYSYMSRQALTYAVRKCLIESGEWKETGVSSDKSVSQYHGEIDTYEEIDLFGYMKTETKTEEEEGKADVRPAVVTFTHAVSMEPYNGDIAFYANPEMARRKGPGANPNPYNRQEHKSIYKYSVVIDLNRVSKKDDSNEQDSKKAHERLSQLLDAIGSLHHQIAADREPLYPLFISAAHIRYGSPIFHNYVEISRKKDDENKLDWALFEKGLNHAGSILKEKDNHKPAWSILEGSGDIHLGMNLEKQEEKKEIPIDVIKQIKGWLNDIYTTKEE